MDALVTDLLSQLSLCALTSSPPTMAAPGAPSADPALPEPNQAPPEPNQALPEPLTPRELDVLALLCGGLTNAEIAEELGVAIGTIKFYTGQIYGKLGVRNRVMAVDRARRDPKGRTCHSGMQLGRNPPHGWRERRDGTGVLGIVSDGFPPTRE